MNITILANNSKWSDLSRCLLLVGHGLDGKLTRSALYMQITRDALGIPYVLHELEYMYWFINCITRAYMYTRKKLSSCLYASLDIRKGVVDLIKVSVRVLFMKAFNFRKWTLSICWESGGSSKVYLLTNEDMLPCLWKRNHCYDISRPLVYEDIWDIVRLMVLILKYCNAMPSQIDQGRWIK
jgi:hypothetical protein